MGFLKDSKPSAKEVEAAKAVVKMMEDSYEASLTKEELAEIDRLNEIKEEKANENL